MRIQDLLQHHQIRANPFSEEDAQTDPVFTGHCITSTFHPAWDKVYGDPSAPATAIVFGEKGSGKTALRLQLARQVARYNQDHPGERLFIVAYDDFNPFLDRFADKLSVRKQRRAERVLSEWKLWDHMDAILTLGVTSLVDNVLGVKHPSGPEGNTVSPDDVSRLDRHQARDLLLLAACYDQSSEEAFRSRWRRLRRKLRYPWWLSHWDKVVGALVTIAVVVVVWLAWRWEWFATPWPYVIAAVGWLPWLWRVGKWWWRARSIVNHIRVGSHKPNSLRRVLAQFRSTDLADQPLPNKDRTDDRYELIAKLQGVLEALGFTGIVVLVDRVDEPHLTSGKPDSMRMFVWPLLDNKFLKHPGLGLKLLLPVELSDYIEKESRDFYQRARLDKQNLVPSLEWTGEALYDLAAARVRACSEDGSAGKLRAMFDESISDQRLTDAFRSLRVPRHLFKFLYRVLVAHANAHREDDPRWTISPELFESVLAVYRRDQEAVDRGLRAG